MSLGANGGYGPELYTATTNGTLNTGGTNGDVWQFEARDDRRIVGAILSVNSDQGFLELSFSSTPNINQGPQDDRSGTIAMGHDTVVLFEEDLWMEWSAGEELHVHTKNNTGGDIPYALTVYYVEEDDC